MKEKKRDGGEKKGRKKDGEREGNRKEGARNKVAPSHSKHESLTSFFYLYSIYEVKLIWLPNI